MFSSVKRKNILFKRLRHSPIISIIILLLAAIFYYYSSLEESTSAEVVNVIDGDTVDVLIANQSMRIRLAAIDAPERSQAFGNEAKQALMSLVKNKKITVIKMGQDQYQRVVAFIKVDDLNVNKEMVRLGLAWMYDQYSYDPSLLLLEAKARENKMGLWLQVNPVPPWLYRKHLLKNR